MVGLMSHPVIAVVIFIGLLIFVHELGHFVVGKLFGIGVETFSIGFGPEFAAFSWRGTRYRLALIPLGGYVKFAGMLPREEIPPHVLGKPMHQAGRWQRAAVLVAGPLANLLLAVVVYTGMGMQGIPHVPAIIGQVLEGSPAAQAGLLPEDGILSIDGAAIRSWDQLREALTAHPEQALSLEVEREGQRLPLTLTPAVVEGDDALGRKASLGRAGISPGALPAIISLNLNAKAAAQAGLKTGDQIINLRVGDKNASLEKSLPLKTWHQCLKKLHWAFSLGAQAITLEVVTAPVPGKESAPSPEPPPLAAPRTITLKTLAWEPLRATAPKEFTSAFAGRLAELLGIVPAQLTIAGTGPEMGEVLKQGDRLLAFKGEAVNSIFELSEKLQANHEAQVQISIQRELSRRDLEVRLLPRERQEMSGKTNYYALDVILWGQPLMPASYLEKYEGLPAAVIFAFGHTMEQSWLMLKMIGSLLVGQVPLQALGGPILIAKVAQDAMEMGWQVFFSTLALISINLGLMNLFPIPVADGGQLMLVLLEALKGRPLSEAALENFQRIGFVMLMALVILATYNDLSRFWASLLRGLGQMLQ